MQVAKRQDEVRRSRRHDVDVVGAKQRFMNGAEAIFLGSNPSTATAQRLYLLQRSPGAFKAT